MNRQVIRAKNFSRAAADFISERARETVAERGEFRIALSGGNTPRPIYSECAGRNLPWERWLFTFGDERCVPPDDEKSNFKMANETWLQPAGVPAERPTSAPIRAWAIASAPDRRTSGPPRVGWWRCNQGRSAARDGLCGCAVRSRPRRRRMNTTRRWMNEQPKQARLFSSMTSFCLVWEMMDIPRRFFRERQRSRNPKGGWWRITFPKCKAGA